MARICGIILGCISIIATLLQLSSLFKRKFKGNKNKRAIYNACCVISFIIGILLVIGSYASPGETDGSVVIGGQTGGTVIGTINIDTINGNVSIGTNSTDENPANDNITAQPDSSGKDPDNGDIHTQPDSSRPDGSDDDPDNGDVPTQPDSIKPEGSGKDPGNNASPTQSGSHKPDGSDKDPDNGDVPTQPENIKPEGSGKDPDNVAAPTQSGGSKPGYAENAGDLDNPSSFSYDEIMGSIESQLGLLAQSNGFLVNSLYASSLINEGMKYCNGANPDYELAGQLFESAIEYGDNESHTAKNNLAYLIRKGLYESDADPEELLSYGVSMRKDMPLTNKALICAERGEWEEADRYFLLLYSTGDYDSVVTWWTKLAEAKDLEGDLVLGWLKRFDSSLVTVKTQQEYLDNAGTIYDIPDWLYEPYE